MLNELTLSYNYAILKRVGYVYFYNGQGIGSPKSFTLEQKSKIIKEYVGFLYFDYNFCENYECKNAIIKKLREYNESDTRLQLKNFRDNFEMLNIFLSVLIKDPDITVENRDYCQKLLYESKIREKDLKKTK